MKNWIYCEKGRGKGKVIHVKVCKACDEECEVRKEIGIIRIAKRPPKEEKKDGDVA